jgi:glycosyltransferase involved in cell wall biosynthesis
MPDASLPKISVITITFQAEQVIERTLKSVMSQRETYPAVEYIIVDGASKDGTMDIVTRYMEGITQVVSEPDKGLYDAMNKGIRMATGDYLCFLNAGDCFHEADTLKKMVSSIGEQGCPDILYGETAIVNGSGQFLHMRRLQAPEQLTWRSFQKGMLVCHQAFFVKRELAEPYDLKYRYSADFDWCIRMMKKAQSLHHTHLVVIDYLEEGMTTNHRYASLWERFHIMAHYYGLFSTLLFHLYFVIRLLKKHC